MAEIESVSTSISQHPKHLRIDRIARDLLSGSIAGFVIVFSGHPLDTIKVRMQMLGGGFAKTATKLIKQEGMLSLYKGISSPLYSTPLVSAVNFASYEAANRFQGITPGGRKTLSTAFLSGGWSGFVYGLVVTPIELIKCKQQIAGLGDRSRGPKAFEITRSIFKQQGISGLGITMLRDVPSIAAQFAIYEQLKILFKNKFGESHLWSFIAGGVGTVVAWVVGYPQDTIKTKIQCSATPLRIKECSRDIYQKAGVMGFWKGLSPCLVRAIVTGATRYVAYDECQKFIGGSRNRH